MIRSIPAIRDRVVQGALKLILGPIFEADFQAGSYGYRPKRTAHEAVARVDLRNTAPVLDPTGKCLRTSLLHLDEKPPSRTGDAAN
jgi:hypothetical protein